MFSLDDEQNINFFLRTGARENILNYFDYIIQQYKKTHRTQNKKNLKNTENFHFIHVDVLFKKIDIEGVGASQNRETKIKTYTTVETR